MNRSTTPRKTGSWKTGGRIAVLALMAASAMALTACGKRGLLETPPPLFGETAKARYAAQQQQDAQDAADARARRGTSVPAADQSDDAPLTTRDIKAPEQRLTPASRAPVSGAPDLAGPAINPNPN